MGRYYREKAVTGRTAGAHGSGRIDGMRSAACALSVLSFIRARRRHARQRRNMPRGGWRTVGEGDRKSTRLNSSHPSISYAVFCLKKKKIRRSVNDTEE